MTSAPGPQIPPGKCPLPCRWEGSTPSLSNTPDLLLEGLDISPFSNLAYLACARAEDPDEAPLLAGVDLLGEEGDAILFEALPRAPPLLVDTRGGVGVAAAAAAVLPPPPDRVGRLAEGVGDLGDSRDRDGEAPRLTGVIFGDLGEDGAFDMTVGRRLEADFPAEDDDGAASPTVVVDDEDAEGRRGEGEGGDWLFAAFFAAAFAALFLAVALASLISWKRRRISAGCCCGGR